MLLLQRIRFHELRSACVPVSKMRYTSRLEQCKVVKADYNKPDTFAFMTCLLFLMYFTYLLFFFTRMFGVCSMFAFSVVFDPILFREKQKEDIQAYTEVQKVLRDGIVNPLRRYK